MYGGVWGSKLEIDVELVCIRTTRMDTVTVLSIRLITCRESLNYVRNTSGTVIRLMEARYP